jgi:hypothetical protein
MRRLVTILSCILAVACTPARPASPTDIPNLPTPGPLTKSALYWDLGLRIKYPQNWVDPQYIDGQMILAPSLESARGQTPTQPVVAVRLVDPGRDLRLPKDATLTQIASAMSAGQSVHVSSSGSTQVAGLDAAYINLADDDANVYGQAIAARMPDGRVAVVIGVAPSGIWANFAPTFDLMRAGTALLKPADFKTPELSDQTSTFPQGGLTLSYPRGWIDKDLGENSRLYRDSAAVEYLDGSGYVNGPQLVIIGESLLKDTSLQVALSQLVKIAPEDKVTDITVGGQPAIQFAYTDRASGQIVNYVSFASQDKSVMIVLRWTAPGILVDALRPTLNAILQSVRFGAVSATLIPLRTPLAGGGTPAATSPAQP